MKSRILTFSPKNTSVHDMHLDAFCLYAQTTECYVIKGNNGFRILADLFRGKYRPDFLFVQSTGMLNILILPLARLLSIKVVYYLHEPTPLFQKIKENAFFKSVIWHFVQFLDCLFSNNVLVSRPLLVKQAQSALLVRAQKLSLAPLLMPKVISDSRAKPFRITYLGRPDERRYLRMFIDSAQSICNLGFRPTILTGNPKDLKKLLSDIPSTIEVFDRPDFSEELKVQVLGETLCLWNPKRGNIAQSGVTADAIRFGLAILLTNKDPAYSTLLEQGVAVDFYESLECNFENLKDVDSLKVNDAAKMIFSEEHGELAFMSSYLPLFSGCSTNVKDDTQ
jgi:hypothetical protein